MSLLDDFARPCVLLEKTRQPDGEGGYTVEWTDGAEFQNYQALDTTMEARIAESRASPACIPPWWTRRFQLSTTTISGIPPRGRPTG